jgi:hypothetical protein
VRMSDGRIDSSTDSFSLPPEIVDRLSCPFPCPLSQTCNTALPTTQKPTGAYIMLGGLALRPPA